LNKLIFRNSANINDPELTTLLQHSRPFADTLYSSILSRAATLIKAGDCNLPNFGLDLIWINVAGTAFAYPVAVRMTDPSNPAHTGVFITKIFMKPTDPNDLSQLKYYQTAFRELDIYRYFNNTFTD